MNFQSLQEMSQFCDVCRIGELGEGTTWGPEKVGMPGHRGALELRLNACPYCSPADHYFLSVARNQESQAPGLVPNGTARKTVAPLVRRAL